ncbi:MAG: DUF1905 domain-containing protein [Demequina sp.]|nr:DUF1905 domain-containing protein [Demequina sp.]
MEFRAEVEPNEKMRGLEVPSDAVAGLGAGARPRVRVTVNDHSWSTRIAIMRGRNLIGLSNANRAAAGLTVGEVVTVRIEVDDSPIVVEEPRSSPPPLAPIPRPVPHSIASRTLSAGRRHASSLRQKARQHGSGASPPC